MTLLLREQEPLAQHTTLGLGGPARYFHECTTEAELREALTWARERRLRVQIMGGGSNLVVVDAGFPGLVLKLAIGGIALRETTQGVELTAAAGVEWDALVRQVVERGWTGIECLSGIPGTVGATPIQNVGAYGQEIAETLVSVRCLERAGLTEVVFPRDQCEFAYRSSRFKSRDHDHYIVLDITLRLYRDRLPQLRYAELAQAVRHHGELERLAPADAVSVVRNTVLELRRRKSMVLDPTDPNGRSVGSFFMNPVLSADAFERLVHRWGAAGEGDGIPTFPADGRVKVPAAWLIEHAGFGRGYRRGGVGISTRHALALVNHGGTTAELLALAEAIERAVYERFGVRLEREPVVVE
ncbi:MAG: UDP-N-acetylenolpyruvoylglucosamine reductase [Gemmatimonadetes bacterium]|nr:MAG: UDP-N-acetylenolpyruvoylglucosamine reductase [Gemmatimonadota bacterium]